MMKAALIARLLCVLILFTGVYASADAHQIHQDSSSHTGQLANEPDSQGDNLDSPSSCAHCCHCHGGAYTFIAGASLLAFDSRWPLPIPTTTIALAQRSIAPDLRPPIS